MPDASGSTHTLPSTRYARCIAASKRVRWDIDRDVLRGRFFETDRKFLPDALTRVATLEFLSQGEQRLLSRIQGRTYAAMFGLVERSVGAKIADVARSHALGDQTAFEALVRFTDEELKHQELFRRVEALAAAQMPDGYVFDHDANAVAAFVLGKSNWAILAFTCCIELATQVHYRDSIANDPALSDVFKDVFLFHWKEESQHAILDELEWLRADADVSADERSAAVTDLIALVAGVDTILERQAMLDGRYFAAITRRHMHAASRLRIEETLLAAYRHQYILSGTAHPRFVELLTSSCNPEDVARIGAALDALRQEASSADVAPVGAALDALRQEAS